ncbi:aminotransferase class III-fold pyridoxal phosphate-dependent enzyme [Peptoniphilus sp. AGMB00490]|uniref:Aminotransferase class III-fold pyridoxal phosphate-dependent enzyme n=1 Tax=Peptoniphilus faecalis TaxID=2731255 RepID=A0A848RCU7_9FIRM|nr:aminotransferase class III-fold pyridoxal phosphate-dependent enzyme [Peptoniphilus faecalis]NMW85668.1 aminotransferase class III-fold pyridoxal phosphate-dependent enzyme [Peptoniphilus faecalis]
MKKNKRLISIDEKYIGKSTRAIYFPLVAKKAEGVKVTDLDGNEFIDMISSACVVNTGYNHTEIVETIKKQIDNYIHFTNDYFYTEPQVNLAKELVRITPGDFDKKVIFGFSGSDAIDSSIKIARAYTGRSKLVSFVGAYHGSTYGAISLSAIDTNMKRKIGPLLPEVFHLDYPNILNKDKNITEDEFADIEFNKFLDNFNYYIPREEVAAIFIEPIIGDLGLIKAPKKFMKRLRKFCDDNKILLVVDEIQQGFGRTGKWFSIEHFDIIPDVVVMGKAMASGLPMSAVLSKREVIDSIDMPAQLFTLQGNALSSVAALKTIEIIERDNLLDRATVLGEYIKSRFKKIKVKSSYIGNIRGTGLSIGVDLEDKKEKYSSNDLVKKVSYRCFEKGVILIYLVGKTLRIQPPLIISDEEIKEAMDIIEEVFEELEQDKIEDKVLKKIKGW